MAAVCPFARALGLQCDDPDTIYCVDFSNPGVGVGDFMDQSRSGLTTSLVGAVAVLDAGAARPNITAQDLTGAVTGYSTTGGGFISMTATLNIHAQAPVSSLFDFNNKSFMIGLVFRDTGTAPGASNEATIICYSQPSQGWELRNGAPDLLTFAFVDVQNFSLMTYSRLGNNTHTFFLWRSGAVMYAWLDRKLIFQKTDIALEPGAGGANQIAFGKVTSGGRNEWAGGIHKCQIWGKAVAQNQAAAFADGWWAKVTGASNGAGND